MKIVFASHNENKLKQIKSLLPQFEVLGLKDVGITEEIKETANSYRGNAELKARSVFYKTGLVCMADDSGLSIDAFDGWPGINTHRFLGENSSRDERNDLILSKLRGIKNRECSVICSICVIDKHGNAFFKEGIFDGQVANEKMGENKFGFDEIIMHNGKTLAQLSEDEKLKINARSIAINKLLPKLEELAIEYKNDKEIIFNEKKVEEKTQKLKQEKIKEIAQQLDKPEIKIEPQPVENNPELVKPVAENKVINKNSKVEKLSESETKKVKTEKTAEIKTVNSVKKEKAKQIVIKEENFSLTSQEIEHKHSLIKNLLSRL